MENKNNASVIIKCTFVLTAITFVVAALLATCNAVAREKIAANMASKAAQMRKAVISAEHFEKFRAGDSECYVAKDADGNTIGYVFTTSEPGYGGAISVMTAIGADGKISGVKILSHNETPGLGANADNPEWVAQFKGLSGGLKVKKDDPNGQIDAVTSATISSRAITRAVNSALCAFQKIRQGGSDK